MNLSVARKVKTHLADMCCICGSINDPVVSFERYGLYPVRVCLCQSCLEGCLEKLQEKEFEENEL